MLSPTMQKSDAITGAIHVAAIILLASCSDGAFLGKGDGASSVSNVDISEPESAPSSGVDAGDDSEEAAADPVPVAGGFLTCVDSGMAGNDMVIACQVWDDGHPMDIGEAEVKRWKMISEDGTTDKVFRWDAETLTAYAQIKPDHRASTFIEVEIVIGGESRRLISAVNDEKDFRQLGSQVSLQKALHFGDEREPSRDSHSKCWGTIEENPPLEKLVLPMYTTKTGTFKVTLKSVCAADGQDNWLTIVDSEGRSGRKSEIRLSPQQRDMRVADLVFDMDVETNTSYLRIDMDGNDNFTLSEILIEAPSPDAIVVIGPPKMKAYD